MKLLNIFQSPHETTHSGTVELVRLLLPNKTPGRIGTMNYAWLGAQQEVEGHQHDDGVEYYLFTAGKGQVEIDSQSVSVEPGDFIQIPKGSWHVVRNVGGSEKLEFVSVRTVEKERV